MLNTNPYEPPTEPTVERSTTKSASWMRSIWTGAIWSILSAFPITALIALFFRFPVPFAGIDGGITHVIPAIFGLLFYGIAMGGFVLLGLCGALAGLVSRIAASSPMGQRHLQRWLSVGATATLLFILATLDWYIGPY